MKQQTNNKAIRLSTKQKDAIKLMRTGFELGNRTGWGASVWLQYNGCGKGGASAKITFGTFHALIDRKLIEPQPNQHSAAQPHRYRLSELGKTINID